MSPFRHLHDRFHDRLAHHFARHAARHGPFGGPPFGGFPFGGPHGFAQDLHDAFGRGRKLSAGDLQLLLLALLAEQPSHGYELIQRLAERSNGYYSPSPGMVYPALTYLEDVGHASVEADGAKKRYTITRDGLDHLEKQRAKVDALLAQLAWIGKRMDDIRHAMSGDDAGGDFDDPRVFRGHGRGRHAAGSPEIRLARRNLKSALIEKSGASAEEQRRIAAILEKAAAAIRSGENA